MDDHYKDIFYKFEVRDFHACIQHGDNRKVLQYIHKYKDNMINEYSDPHIYRDRMTPLCTAILHNNIDAVDILLKHGVNIDLCFTVSPHYFAKKTGDRTLIMALTKINCYKYWGVSDTIDLKPIFFAVIYGRNKIVEILLKKGVDVNENNGGYTLLHLSPNMTITKLLLMYGADTIIKDMNGRFSLGDYSQEERDDLIKKYSSPLDVKEPE